MSQKLQIHIRENKFRLKGLSDCYSHKLLINAIEEAYSYAPIPCSITEEKDGQNEFDRMRQLLIKLVVTNLTDKNLCPQNAEEYNQIEKSVENTMAKVIFKTFQEASA